MGERAARRLTRPDLPRSAARRSTRGDDGGRAWLTTLGHDVAAWTDAPLAGDEYFKEHVMNGLESSMGIKPFCQ